MLHSKFLKGVFVPGRKYQYPCKELSIGRVPSLKRFFTWYPCLFIKKKTLTRPGIARFQLGARKMGYHARMQPVPRTHARL